MKARDDRAGCTVRHDYTVPACRFVAGQRLGQRGNIGRRLRARGTRHRQCTQSSRADRRQRGREIRKVHRDLAGDRVVQRLCRRAVRDFDDADARHRTHEFGAQVTRRAAPGVRIVELTRRCLREFDQIFRARRLDLRTDDEHRRKRRHQRDRREIARDVVRQILDEQRAHDDRR